MRAGDVREVAFLRLTEGRDAGLPPPSTPPVARAGPDGNTATTFEGRGRGGRAVSRPRVGPRLGGSALRGIRQKHAYLGHPQHRPPPPSGARVHRAAMGAADEFQLRGAKTRSSSHDELPNLLSSHQQRLDHPHDRRGPLLAPAPRCAARRPVWKQTRAPRLRDVVPQLRLLDGAESPGHRRDVVAVR